MGMESEGMASKFSSKIFWGFQKVSNEVTQNSLIILGYWARVRKFQGKKTFPEFRESFRGIPFHITTPPLKKKLTCQMIDL